MTDVTIDDPSTNEVIEVRPNRESDDQNAVSDALHTR
jgi:hypothetical protein